MIEMVKGALDRDFCEYLSLSMDMMMDFLGNPKDPGNISNSNGYYSPVCFEPLLLHLQSMVEDSVEEIVSMLFIWQSISSWQCIAKA